jgi:hypothetical protein
MASARLKTVTRGPRCAKFADPVWVVQQCADDEFVCGDRDGRAGRSIQPGNADRPRDSSLTVWSLGSIESPEPSAGTRQRAVQPRKHGEKPGPADERVPAAFGGA